MAGRRCDEVFELSGIVEKDKKMQRTVNMKDKGHRHRHLSLMVSWVRTLRRAAVKHGDHQTTMCTRLFSDMRADTVSFLLHEYCPLHLQKKKKIKFLTTVFLWLCLLSTCTVVVGTSTSLTCSMLLLHKAYSIIPDFPFTIHIHHGDRTVLRGCGPVKTTGALVSPFGGETFVCAKTLQKETREP